MPFPWIPHLPFLLFKIHFHILIPTTMSHIWSPSFIYSYHNGVCISLVSTPVVYGLNSGLNMSSTGPLVLLQKHRHFMNDTKDTHTQTEHTLSWCNTAAFLYSEHVYLILIQKNFLKGCQLHLILLYQCLQVTSNLSIEREWPACRVWCYCELHSHGHG